jgi:hypothetical protein
VVRKVLDDGGAVGHGQENLRPSGNSLLCPTISNEVLKMGSVLIQ